MSNLLRRHVRPNRWTIGHRLHGSSSDISVPSPPKQVSSRLVEYVHDSFRRSISDLLNDSELRAEAPAIADRMARQLVSDPTLAATNSDLDLSSQSILHALTLLSSDELHQAVEGKITLADLIATLQAYKAKNVDVFNTITSHHAKLMGVQWEQAVTDESALAKYSESAAAMGDKPWVQHANHWMAKFIVNFFIHGGAVKHHVKFNASGKLSRSDFSKNVMASLPTNDPQAAETRRIRVLDVGSCYNPLARTEFASQLDILPVDLCPATEAVLQCDFLSVEVGPAGTDPVIEVDPQNPHARRVTRLPAEAFDAVTMSLVLSYLPSPDQRSAMVAKAQRLLRNSDAAHPHYRGLLLIVEKQSIFAKAAAAASSDGLHLHSQASLLNAWKQEFASSGWELAKYLALGSPEVSSVRRSHAFAVVRSADPVASSAPVGQPTDGTSLRGLWIKQDFDVAQGLQPLFLAKNTILPVGIVGGGIAGAALAVALEKNGVPSLLFEKDDTFDRRRQGYALTIQQASMTLNDLGLSAQVVSEGAASRGHFSFDHLGNPIGAYGHDCGGADDAKEANPRKALSKHNIHIPRQGLRQLMLDQLPKQRVLWNKRFAALEETAAGEAVQVSFGDGSTHEVSVLVGADGIFSGVRKALVGGSGVLDAKNPFGLTFLGLMVILGISPVRSSRDGSSLCQRQWLDGCTRVFTMPFNRDWSMWQMSFPMSEAQAMEASRIGEMGGRCSESAAKGLKAVALSKCVGWNRDLLEIIERADESLISGHPVYDRDLVGTGVPTLSADSRVTLIGDAAHPMSPFKGQGANQALLDALHLSKTLLSSELAGAGRRRVGLALRSFEVAMAQRVTPKVEKSRDAAIYLHSPAALTVANVTRASAAGQAFCGMSAGETTVRTSPSAPVTA